MHGRGCIMKGDGYSYDGMFALGLPHGRGSMITQVVSIICTISWRRNVTGTCGVMQEGRLIHGVFVRGREALHLLQVLPVLLLLLLVLMLCVSIHFLLQAFVRGHAARKQVKPHHMCSRPTHPDALML